MPADSRTDDSRRDAAPARTEQRDPGASAVAIRAEAGDDIAAPARVVAKGRGAVAEQILELAFATGVKVREDADLVEVLEAVEVDCEVPLHALAAVADILAYVYRANGALAATGSAAGPATADPEPEHTP